MSNLYKNYLESFPNEFSILHKISSQTEKKSFHMHKQLEIIYTLSDNLKCRTEQGIVDLPSNTLVLFNTMDLHYIFSEPGSGICDRYVLYFSSSFISSLSTQEVNLLECFNVNQLKHPVLLFVSEKQQGNYIQLMEQMISYQEKTSSGQEFKENYGYVLHIKFLLGQFLLLINQLYYQKYGYMQESLYRSHSQMVMEICEFLQTHITEDVSTDFLSKQFHISKTQLYNMFKEILGMTASDFLTEYRINCAKNYLINSGYSIEMIGEMVGYNNLSSFSRIFKSLSDCSPLQYRKKHKISLQGEINS